MRGLLMNPAEEGELPSGAVYLTALEMIRTLRTGLCLRGDDLRKQIRITANVRSGKKRKIQRGTLAAAFQYAVDRGIWINPSEYPTYCYSLPRNDVDWKDLTGAQLLALGFISPAESEFIDVSVRSSRVLAWGVPELVENPGPNGAASPLVYVTALGVIRLLRWRAYSRERLADEIGVSAGAISNAFEYLQDVRSIIVDYDPGHRTRHITFRNDIDWKTLTGHDLWRLGCVTAEEAEFYDAGARSSPRLVGPNSNPSRALRGRWTSPNGVGVLHSYAAPRLLGPGVEPDRRKRDAIMRRLLSPRW